MSEFYTAYKRVLDNAGGVLGISESIDYASSVQQSVDNAISALRHTADHRKNVDTDYLKGWLAEQWHAETLKISGAVRNRNDIWATVPNNNKPGEDVRFGNGSVSGVAEVKFYKSGEKTAKAISNPFYRNSEKIVPEDQIKSVKAEAENLAKDIFEKNKTKRFEQAKHYQDTADRSTDRLSLENISSKPLEEQQAKRMAKDFKRDGDIDPDIYGLNSEAFVEWTDVARQAGEAALHAAALSAAFTAAPHIWAVLCEYCETGTIDSQTLANRGHAVLMGTGSAGLRGGVAGGMVIACRTGLMGSSLKMVSPAAIGMATTITLNAIGDAIKLYQGKLSGQEFAINCMRDAFVLSSGVYGATVGQLIIPIPVLGAIAGNLVGSTLGAVVFEGLNHVVFGLHVESGWTFFNTVNQNYTVSEEVLINAGYDLFATRTFSTESFPISSFNVQSFDVNTLSFTPVRRGLISCNTVGYF